MTDDRQAALELLHDHYDLEECPKCEIREEFGLVLGDRGCAIGVAVCPHCGYHSRCLTADPAGVATDHPYDQLYRIAMEWVPDWHPDEEDVTADWSCACGKTWKTKRERELHIAKQHPDDWSISMRHHDRYPCDNVDLGEEAVVEDG